MIHQARGAIDKVCELGQALRYGGYGGIGYYMLSDMYIARFSRFTTCVAMSKALERLIAEGYAVDLDLIACSSPY